MGEWLAFPLCFHVLGALVGGVEPRWGPKVLGAGCARLWEEVWWGNPSSAFAHFLPGDACFCFVDSNPRHTTRTHATPTPVHIHTGARQGQEASPTTTMAGAATTSR